MPYCPKCRYEYKPTVETCPDCGSKLVAKLRQKKRKKIVTLEISEAEVLSEPKLKLLYASSNLIYVNFLKETLKKNGIPCLVKKESMGLIPALVSQPLTDIRIFVREEDFGKSCEIKEQIVDNL